MVGGHPFKEEVYSQAYLTHPDMKRFNIADSFLYAPPRPDAYANPLTLGFTAAAATGAPAFGDFFATYFAGRSFNVADNKCSVVLEGMKRCYENHTNNSPVEQCQYYIQGFERMACGAN